MHCSRLLFSSNIGFKPLLLNAVKGGMKLIFTLHALFILGSKIWCQDTIRFQRDYLAGTYDASGKFMGGTETSWLVAHKNQLFAGIGYWKDAPGADPQPGAQILVKACHNCAWEAEISFGHPAYLGLEALSC
jgi:hypothetical protein